jgi:hypothetical protein
LALHESAHEAETPIFQLETESESLQRSAMQHASLPEKAFIPRGSRMEQAPRPKRDDCSLAVENVAAPALARALKGTLPFMK